ncbi:thiolase family protein [Geosporobacter ferrireducens]|uniref:thiolase family protein n=1 Tax=Geosporobacter ferrireducens TaxID=1424294 RepID=UPI0023551ADD|nr:acetyl-CoA C-acyltransferase [Geosporobacter ferrireducens]
MMKNNAVLVAMGRSAIGKAPKGTLRYTRPEELASQVLQGVLAQLPDLPQGQIDDLILGCAMPEAEQGLNVARMIALKAGLGESTPGQTINRFCASGLQSIAIAANTITSRQNDIVIAGGLESMSALPMGGNMMRPDPGLIKNSPHVYDSMGITAENVAAKYHISRENQDAFSVRSHVRAYEAAGNGKFVEEIIPVYADVIEKTENGRTVTNKIIFDKDEGIRSDSSIEALAKLKPIFKVKGSVTPGNSSQTSDGAAFVVMMSEDSAKAFGYQPIAKLIGYSVVGVPPDLMGIGPIYAIPKVLQRNGLTLKDIDLIELNEAFASQSIACINELGLNIDKVNVNGGAIALGHPLGCTGTVLTIKLLQELRRRGQKRGIVSMCIGGGMGAAGVFELIG